MIEFLGVMFAIGTSSGGYVVQHMTDAQMRRRRVNDAKVAILWYWPVVIGISEAFRASYSSFMLSGEATWSFGQIFAFTMLLSALFELFSNATANSDENPSMNRFQCDWWTKAGGVKGTNFTRQTVQIQGFPNISWVTWLFSLMV